jgi:hypothetical protein
VKGNPFVRIARVNKVVTSYTYITNVINNVAKITNNVVVPNFLPSGEKGNLSAYLTNALLKNSHIVHLTRPSSNNKSESYIEVTDR